MNGDGWRKIKRSWRRRIAERRARCDFDRWLKLHDSISAGQREEMRRQTRTFARQPLISVLLPVYNVEEKWLRWCLDSVLKQIYENWELCVADDCSQSPHVRRILKEYAARDARIKVVFRKTNGHISAASNSALEMATGEFAALLDHDDELAEDALVRVVEEINAFPAADFIYSDEDMIDENGRRYEPKFKPDFSRDLLYSVNYVTHLAIYRTAILKKIGGWRAGLEGSQDYDLALRVIEQIPEKNIRHVPRILYHWRAIRGSTALNGGEKPYAHERAREAIRVHLERSGKKATVSPTVYDLHRVRYNLPAPPKASLIMFAGTDDAATARAIGTFAGKTDYQNLEIVLVCSAAREKFFAAIPVVNLRTIVCEAEGEAALYNAAVERADGEVLCFVSENLRPVSADWLRELVGFAVQPEIGAAGAKITSVDGTILHGGIVLGIDGLTGAAHGGLPAELGGSLARAQIVNNFSATAIDCLATRRATFRAAGGFDAEHFPNKLFDVDFCLRLRAENLRVVWTPHAELVQFDRKRLLNLQKKPTGGEREFFRRMWRGVIEHDPFYNPNFSRRGESFKIDA